MQPRYGNHFQGEERIGSSPFYRGAKLSSEILTMCGRTSSQCLDSLKRQKKESRASERAVPPARQCASDAEKTYPGGGAKPGGGGIKPGGGGIPPIGGMPGMPGGGANDCGACRLSSKESVDRSSFRGGGVVAGKEERERAHIVGGAERPIPRPAGAPNPGPGAS